MLNSLAMIQQHILPSSKDLSRLPFCSHSTCWCFDFSDVFGLANLDISCPLACCSDLFTWENLNILKKKSSILNNLRHHHYQPKCVKKKVGLPGHYLCLINIWNNFFQLKNLMFHGFPQFFSTRKLLLEHFYLLI